MHIHLIQGIAGALVIGTDGVPGGDGGTGLGNHKGSGIPQGLVYIVKMLPSLVALHGILFQNLVKGTSVDVLVQGSHVGLLLHHILLGLAVGIDVHVRSLACCLVHQLIQLGIIDAG